MAAQKKPVINPHPGLNDHARAGNRLHHDRAEFVAGWSLFGYYGGPSGLPRSAPPKSVWWSAAACCR